MTRARPAIKTLATGPPLGSALAAAVLAVGIDKQDVLNAIRQRLQNTPSNDGWLWLTVAIVASTALLLLIWHLVRRKPPAPTRQRRDWLAEAIDVLQLSPSQRADLQRLAARARPAEPAAMLLSPANLAHAYAEAFTETDDSALWARLDALAVQLFEEHLPPPDADRLRPGKSRRPRDRQTT